MNDILIKNASQPLYSAKGWLKFLGVMMILGGVFTALTIVGLIVAWIPIWQGVLLFQAANAIDKAYTLGNAAELVKAQQKVKTYFMIMAILMLLGAIFYGFGLFVG